MELTHFDQDGNAIMVDVSGKENTQREAVAEGTISMNEPCYRLAKTGESSKGDILGTARIAGIMAVKKTSDLIPLCHNLLIQKVTVDFEYDDKEQKIKVIVTVKTSGKTGVEMEALTGVNITLLTIYDMCKALDKFMTISEIQLLKKTGGKSGVLINEGSVQ